MALLQAQYISQWMTALNTRDGAGRLVAGAQAGGINDASANMGSRDARGMAAIHQEVRGSYSWARKQLRKLLNAVLPCHSGGNEAVGFQCEVLVKQFLQFRIRQGAEIRHHIIRAGVN